MSVPQGAWQPAGLSQPYRPVQNQCGMFLAAEQGKLSARFLALDTLGAEVWEEEKELFDVATCMFALHYFFTDEHALEMLLHNVAINLREGGRGG